MNTYILKRLFQALLILIINSFLIFSFSRLSTDPMAQYVGIAGFSAEDRARVSEELGLDQPFPVQYFLWLQRVVRGDLGISLFSKQPVWTLIIERLPMTLILMFSAQIVTLLLAFLLAFIAMRMRYSLLDNIISTLSFVGYSMPVFLIGLILIIIFSVKFKEWGLPYLPTGTGIWDHRNLIDLIRHLVLPVTTIASIQIASYSRFLRSSLLETMSNDYVRTAVSKGLGSQKIMFKHILPNALLPIVSMIGLDIGAMFGGAVVTESIFAWPGLGRLFWEYAQRGDFPVVNGVLLITSTAVVLMTIVTDIVYGLIDPRIHYD